MSTISIKDIVKVVKKTDKPNPWPTIARMVLTEAALDINPQGLQICAKVASYATTTDKQTKAIYAIASKSGINIVD